MKEIGIFRVEYELLPGMSAWTAFIAAYSPEEAFAYLERLLGKGKVHMTSIGFQCRLDGFSTEVRDYLNSISIGAPKAPKAVEETIGGPVPKKPMGLKRK